MKTKAKMPTGGEKMELFLTHSETSNEEKDEFIEYQKRGAHDDASIVQWPGKWRIDPGIPGGETNRSIAKSTRR